MKKLISVLLMLSLFCFPAFAGVTNVDTLNMDDTGSASAPALGFGSDTNTGIYRIGADNIGITAGGTKALDISATGTSITGTLSSTGDTSFTSATASKPVVTIKNTNADANSCSLILQKSSASPTPNDTVGNVIFRAWDSEAPTTENATDYAKVVIKAPDETDGTEDGSIDIQVMEAGTLRTVFAVTGGEWTQKASTSNASLTTGNINVKCTIRADDGTTQVIYLKGNTGT